jgi:hypothetical protein
VVRALEGARHPVIHQSGVEVSGREWVRAWQREVHGISIRVLARYMCVSAALATGVVERSNLLTGRDALPYRNAGEHVEIYR